jgi:hypothetical protein
VEAFWSYTARMRKKTYDFFLAQKPCPWQKGSWKKKEKKNSSIVIDIGS